MSEVPRLDIQESWADRMADARKVFKLGEGAAAAWLAEDPEAATLAENLRLQAQEHPGVVEGALHRREDEEIMADPRVQESIRQMEAGELTDITPAD